MKKIKMLLAVMLIISGIGIVSASDKCIGTARCSEWTTAEPKNWIEVRNGGSLYPYGDQWIYLYSSANIAYGDNAFSSGTTPEGWTYVYKNSKLEFHPSKGDSIWIWVTGRVTYQNFVQRTARGDDMQPNEVLHSNDYIRSPSGQFTLRYQSDGNLVLIDEDNKALWDSETFGKPSGTVVMQDDGNLVIYDSDRRPIWDSETFGNPGAWLFVQNDGNVIIDNTYGKAIWDTETWQPDDKIWHPRYPW